ncbi:protein MIZU-KUSSEI 1-like [Lolium rigidum]|uniref:protein MIZU-KUSSEI 1-like n=1 Tax=Lolium rigidum TaxID=89674 RepID=UPI001F5D70A7|nr:protein MIZU-KUSSEI 1-like [Lolium rigidum]
MADAAAPNRDHSRTRQASSMSSVDCYLQFASPSPSPSPSSSPSSSPSPSAPSPTPAAARGHALEEPPKRKRPSRRSKPVRMFQSMCRSLPVVTAPRCGRLLQPQPAAGTPAATTSPARLSSSDSFLSHLISPTGGAAGTSSSHRRMTGTLFGYRDGRVALALQENPRCRPALVVELALQTHVLLREIGTTAGARIVLECEKKHVVEEHGSGAGEDGGSAGGHDDEGWLLEEPIWTMFCNGKRVGYAVRREPTDADVSVLETLWAVSMGGGVLPGRAGADAPDGEMAYMRGCFEHVIGSRDSESLYMLGPQGGDCPELAVFFVRL